jgi:hypothetical protein
MGQYLLTIVAMVVSGAGIVGIMLWLWREDQKKAARLRT